MKKVTGKKIFLNFIFCTIAFVAQGKSGQFEMAKMRAVTDFLLKNYTRQFTALLLASEEEWIDYIAGNFESIAVVIGYEKDIAPFSRKHKYSNVMVLGENISLKKLRKLSDCEHFDITIVTSKFLSNYQNNWRHAFKSIMLMGDHVIVDVKNCSDIASHCRQNSDEIYGSNTNNLFYMKTCNPYLQKNYWSRDPKRSFNPQNYNVQSDFRHKMLLKRKHKIFVASDWISGINLDTFCNLSGRYPEKKAIISALYALQHIEHDDVKIHNMVIQGKKIRYIDIPVTGLVREDNLNAKYRRKRLQKIALELKKKLKVYK